MYDEKFADLDSVNKVVENAEKTIHSFLCKVLEPILGDDTSIYVDSIMECRKGFELVKTIQDERRELGNNDNFYASVIENIDMIKSIIAMKKLVKGLADD